VVALTVAEETLQTKNSGSPLASLWRLGVVLNTDIRLPAAHLSPVSIAMARFFFLLRQETFGVSSQVFSFFFAIFAGFGDRPSDLHQAFAELEAHLDHHRLFRRDRARGILVLLGRVGTWAYILAVLPSSVALGCMRPRLCI
jgi:hypothetical protein